MTGWPFAERSSRLNVGSATAPKDGSWPVSAPSLTGLTKLHLCLLGHFKCVVYLDAEVSHCTFELSVTKQQLDRPEILRAAIDQRRFSPAHRVGTVSSVVKAD